MQIKNIRLHTKTLAAVGYLAVTISAPAAITLINGDFEDTSGSFPNGWSGSATQEDASPLQGLVSASSAAIHQDFAATDSDGLFNFQLDFMVTLDSLDQSQRVRIRDNNNADDLITLRFNSAGIDRFSSSWGQALATTISAGTDYHVRIIGSDLDLASRSFTVALSTDGINYTTGASNTGFHFAGVGSNFETIRLESGTAGATWDAVSVIVVPEPSAAVLLGLSGFAFTLRRKRP